MRGHALHGRIGRGGEGIWEDIFHPGMLNAGLVQSATFYRRIFPEWGK